MARSIASDINGVLRRLQSRQTAEMESLLAARSPQQLTCLRGFLGAGGLAQRPMHSRACFQDSRGHDRSQPSTATSHQPSSDSSTQMQQKRSVSTSPTNKQQMLMYSDSVAASSPPRLMAKALDLLRSRDHLQHLGDANAVHVELMRTLELAQEFYRQTRIPSTQRAVYNDRQLTALPELHKDEQSGDSLAAPAEYEGMAAQLPQQAVEAGVILDATVDERRQGLFNMALDDAHTDQTDQRPDRYSNACSHLRPSHLLFPQTFP